MARRPPPRIEPTEAQLRAAFEAQHWRRRYTFDEAMADESLRRVLRMLAVQAARTALRRQVVQAKQTRQAQAPARTPAQHQTTPQLFDRKRAAAGEREDD